MKKSFLKVISNIFRKSSITYFIISYIIVLIVPIALNSAGYTTSQKTVKSVLENYNVNLLNKSVRIFLTVSCDNLAAI